MATPRPLDYAREVRGHANRKAHIYKIRFLLTLSTVAGTIAVLSVVAIAIYLLVAHPDNETTTTATMLTLSICPVIGFAIRELASQAAHQQMDV